MLNNGSNLSWLTSWNWKGIFILSLLSLSLRSSPASSPNPMISAYVFPNPIFKNNLSKIHVEAGVSLYTGLSIFSIDGEKIVDMPRVSDQHSFDVTLDNNQFRSGVYTAIIRVISADNSVSQKKIQFTVIK